jgi:transcriptional regulator with XRE-family HTH domain
MYTMEILNPLKTIRTNAGISQIGMAHRLGVSRQYVTRIEQGLYAHLPDEVLTEYATLGDRPVAVLQEQYEEVIWAKRESLVPTCRAVNWSRFLEALPENNGLELLRETLGFNSRISFCIKLAVHPSTVLLFETDRTKKLPTDVVEALLTAGVPSNVIYAIDEGAGNNG